MTKLLTGICRKGKVLRLMALCLLVVMITFYGCVEKKDAGTKGAKEGVPVATYTCEYIDKLPGDAAKPIEVIYGNKIKLLGIAFDKLSQAQIKVSYYWQLLGDLDMYDHVFVHFTGADNKILFQGDHAFCQKRSFAELKGKVIKETQLIAVPEAVLGKEITVKIGIFSLATPRLDRLKIESINGAVKGDGDTSAGFDKLHF